MPLYLFTNHDESKTVEVFFHMNDKKVFIDENGVEWRRLYTSPQLSIDTDFDPRNKEEFMRRGEKYKDLGSVIDKSRELSEKRAQKEGIDPIRQQFFDQYNKDRGGNKPHPASKPKKIETDRVVVDFTAKG